MKKIPDEICPKCKSTENWLDVIPKEHYKYNGWEYKDNWCFECSVGKVENEEEIINNEQRKDRRV